MSAPHPTCRRWPQPDDEIDVEHGFLRRYFRGTVVRVEESRNEERSECGEKAAKYLIHYDDGAVGFSYLGLHRWHFADDFEEEPPGSRCCRRAVARVEREKEEEEEGERRAKMKEDAKEIAGGNKKEEGDRGRHGRDEKPLLHDDDRREETTAPATAAAATCTTTVPAVAKNENGAVNAHPQPTLRREPYANASSSTSFPLSTVAASRAAFRKASAPPTPMSPTTTKPATSPLRRIPTTTTTSKKTAFASVAVDWSRPSGTAGPVRKTMRGSSSGSGSSRELWNTREVNLAAPIS